MKFSAADIPLTVFAASAAGLIGVAFSAGPLSVLPHVIRTHGLLSFMAVVDVLVACAGMLVILLSVAVGFRRRWAYAGLVRSIFGVMIVAVLAIARKALQEERTLSERLMDITAGPVVLLAMATVLLFLMNRRVQEELVPPRQP